MNVKVAAEPSFTIEKQQRIKGEANYSTGELTGKLGQTVEYKIIVKNTGNLPLKFSALKDTGCEGIAPAGATELAVGKEESFTCTHVLARRHLHQRSLDRRQRRHGHQDLQQSHRQSARRTLLHDRKAPEDRRRRPYTTGELSGKLGQTVEYKIIVKNTGNLALKFSALKDTGCEGIAPAGATELAVGKEESFTCTHALAVGTYTNEASIEGNEDTGTKSSNKVTAKVRRRTLLHDRKAAEDQRRSQLQHRRTRPANSARPSNTRSSSRTPATCRSNSAH